TPGAGSEGRKCLRDQLLGRQVHRGCLFAVHVDVEHQGVETLGDLDIDRTADPCDELPDRGRERRRCLEVLTLDPDLDGPYYPVGVEASAKARELLLEQPAELPGI